MIKSMTGYGSASYEDEDVLISVEVKTLNSKFLDLNIRSPKQLSEKELEIRNLVSKVLDRGKVNLNIEYLDKSGQDLPVQINEELFEAYILKYQNLADKVGIEVADLFKLAIQSANVVTNVVEKKSDTGNWDLIKKVIEEALVNCDAFRMDEGNVLLGKFRENLDVIQNGLEEIKRLDPVRKERIRERISSNFKDWLEENEFDKNRFEQELIYYFEKIDITEEIVRLGAHLDYFLKNMEEGNAQGKKLGFISQEIGREINTIGSKANDAKMQQFVVVMKDELEKIKEQSLNIL
ncbi:YicC/YloC family endoribonuclease [Arthrospiribacter ruber]|uniref:YicC family protein n=1 Tax=Arthrospiribacter ruber TaxID=2487934 RepID=A0A951IT62_9BACT|nr:YicC/YloC family endoribonuclease [Arthrospiribacter ruber]MBW3466304.1 YicC family protein [Arthrospiribacter ruber]